MSLIQWLKKNLNLKLTDAEEKKAEAKASKLRAMENMNKALEIIESEQCTADQLDSATVWGQQVTLNLKRETDKLKEKRA